MTEERTLAADIRTELLSSLDRWRDDIPDDGGPSTMWFGVVTRASGLASALIRTAVATLLPEVALRERPTVGMYVQTLDEHGKQLRGTCIARPNRLVSKADLQVLRRFTRLRAALAHQEDVGVGPSEIGRFDASTAGELLDTIELLAGLPLFDETICLQSGKGPAAR